MSKELNVLHLASFKGNIGDYANNKGFYKKIKEKVYYNFKFDQLEVRKFYKNIAELRFDDSLIKLINKHDLFIIGGGGFFDLAWDYSSTGTTIDFSELFIQKIKVPVIVNAMGYHEFDEVKEENVDKFKRFLELIVNNDYWSVSVRNDGSYNRMSKRYGSLVNNILKIPDHGFFFKPREYNLYVTKDDKIKWLGLSITNDLFSERFNGDISVDNFNNMIGQFINEFLSRNSNYGIALIPHTPLDISTIGIIMDKIKDKYRREKVIVAPIAVGDMESADYVFDLYKSCACIIAMRFHVNVCAIAMNIPTIGLAGHEQISSLYDELGLSESCIKVNNDQLVDELICKLNLILKMPDKIKKDYAKLNFELNRQADQYHEKMRNWIFERVNI